MPVTEYWCGIVWPYKTPAPVRQTFASLVTTPFFSKTYTCCDDKVHRPHPQRTSETIQAGYSTPATILQVGKDKRLARPLFH